MTTGSSDSGYTGSAGGAGSANGANNPHAGPLTPLGTASAAFAAALRAKAQGIVHAGALAANSELTAAADHAQAATQMTWEGEAAQSYSERAARACAAVQEICTQIPLLEQPWGGTQ